MRCFDFLEPGCIVHHGHVDVLRDRSWAPKSRIPYRELKEQEVVEEGKSENEDGFVTTYIFSPVICCPSEVGIIDKILKPLPGVESVDTMIITKTVKVVHEASKVSPSALVAALNDAKLQATLGKKGGKTGPHKVPFPLHILASGILLIVSLLSLIDEDLEHAKWLALGSIVFGVPGVLLRAFISVRNFMLDINVLMVIAVAGAVGITEYQEAGAIVFLFGAAEWLEMKCMGRARNAVNALLEIQPDTAMSADTRKLIPIEKVQIDDQLIVRPGDRVPVDGVVVEGSSTLDESMLTGETRPVLKKVNAKVTSGTINCGHASLRIRATATADDSTVAALSKLIEQASLQKSRTARLVERFSKVYTPVVVTGALGLVIIPLSVGVDNIDDWIYLALVLLVTACPCALVISTPVTTVCGISRAAREGILIKGGQYLEALAHLKAITFDKTGTLTEGCFGVIVVEAFDGHSKEDVLEWAAALELHSTHPIGPSIVGCAAARGVVIKNTASRVETTQGMGIAGIVDERSVWVGNMMLVQKAMPKYDVSNLQSLEETYLPQGASICYVCVEDSIMGAIVVSDCLRADAAHAVQKLQKRHLTVGMLTGDRRSAAELVGEQLGIQPGHTHAELLPEDKLTKVAEYRSAYGVEAHVGDGMNDTLALARADVGIAMGIAGSAMAVEAADVALFTNDLMNLVLAIDIGRRVHWKIFQNIVFSITLKVVVIILASTGDIMLWIAVIADVGSAILVVLNGLTLLTYQSGIEAESTSAGYVCEKAQNAQKKRFRNGKHREALARASDSVLRSLLMVSPRSPVLRRSRQSGEGVSACAYSHQRTGSGVPGALEHSGIDSISGSGHRKTGSWGGYLLGHQDLQQMNSSQSGCSKSEPESKPVCGKGCCGAKVRGKSPDAMSICTKESCQGRGGAEPACRKECCTRPPETKVCDTTSASSKISCANRAGTKMAGTKPECRKGCCTTTSAGSKGGCTHKAAIETPEAKPKCAKGCSAHKAATETPEPKPKCAKGCCGDKIKPKTTMEAETDRKSDSGNCDSGKIRLDFAKGGMKAPK